MEKIPTSVIEQPPEDLKDWSAEDIAWLKHVPEELQGVARRHGRWLFALTMQSGGVMHAFGIIGRQARGNRAISQAILVIGNSYDNVLKGYLEKIGLTPQDLLNCRRDIETTMSLAQGGKQIKPGDRVSPGGIILNS